MVNAKLAIIAGAAVLATGTETVGAAIDIVQSRSGQVPVSASGAAPEASRYTGERTKARLVWTDKAGGDGADERGQYTVAEVRTGDGTAGDIIGPLHIDGAGATLERNVPFAAGGKKFVGLYIPASVYGMRAWAAEFTPAVNVTHVFYSASGLCDFGANRPADQTIPASHNNGLAADGDEQGRRTLKALCGRGGHPLPNAGGKAGSPTRSKAGSPAGPRDDFNLVQPDPQAAEFLLRAMRRMKQANPALSIMLSIGGRNLSSPFHGMVETDTGRKTFIASVVRFLEENPAVDGIDLDWKYPGGGGVVPGLAVAGLEAEKERYTALVLGLREALDRRFTGAARKQLSAAVSGSPAELAAIDFERLSDALDFVNVMSYDLYGASGRASALAAPGMALAHPLARYPGHQAGLHAKPVASAYGAPGADEELADEAGRPILIDGHTVTQRELLAGYSAEGAIKSILENNPAFPPEKLNLGVASSGRSWHSVRVRKEHDKLFWHGVAAGANESPQGLGTAGTWKAGETDFRELYDKYMRGDAANLYYDTQAQAAYAWVAGAPQDGYTVASVDSFDDPRSVIAKGEFIKAHQLGGIVAPDASADNGLLLNAMNAAVCNKLANGAYYAFSQRYAGDSRTEIRPDSPSGIQPDIQPGNRLGNRLDNRLGNQPQPAAAGLMATRSTPDGSRMTVSESVSGPRLYVFDAAAAKQLCEADVSPLAAPTVNAGADQQFVNGLHGAAQIALHGSAIAAAGGAISSVLWRLEGKAKGIVIEKPEQLDTTVALPATIAARDYYFQLTATNAAGETAAARVKLAVARPKAKIDGKGSATTGAVSRFTLTTNLDEQPEVDWVATRANGEVAQAGLGVTFDFKPDAAGKYVLSGTVTDVRGRTTTARRTVNVKNAVVKPVVDIVGGELAYDGTDYTSLLSANLAGAGVEAGKFSYAWSVIGVDAVLQPNGNQAKLIVKRTAANQSFKVKVTITGPDLARPVVKTRTLKLLGTDAEDRAFLKTLVIQSENGMTHLVRGEHVALAVTPVPADPLQAGRLVYEWSTSPPAGVELEPEGNTAGLTIPRDFKRKVFSVGVLVRSNRGKAQRKLTQKFTLGEPAAGAKGGHGS
jgi:chitinase